jgi:two-component system response regulator
MKQQPTKVILLVEDNALEAELTERALQCTDLNHCKLVTVQDGVDALDFLHCRGKYQNRHGADEPWLVLMDLKMPRLDGLQTLQELRNHEKTASLPVILMTTSAQEHEVAKAYRTGANGYIQKPIRFEQFVRVLEDLGHYWFDTAEIPEPKPCS